ncbi:PDZ domain-containing protein [Egibacter rhizosphaerae]|uniref:PDZ domain-containing protein n=1 Tax=Egibacter rhizosphaerae TaxID=1670831 RepID=A0A411YDZ4_9ACTN|nr:PDZ domain-containing protein [Egibacter rhizosphaerae]QBI19464.1 PDZ domain-containing protein [Egibacter rhizosphaerae]
MRSRMGWLKRWPAWFLVVGIVLIVAAGFRAPLPYFVETTGSVVTLGGCVDVHAEDTLPVHGDFMLTTVSLRRATPFGVVASAVDPSARLRPDDRVVTPGVDDRDHFAGQRRVFSQTAQRAAALGLQAAGFGVDPDRLIGDGARVTGIVEDSPAEGLLRGGDVIIGVDGQAIGTEAELRAAIDDTEPMVLRIERGGQQHDVEITPSELTIDGQEQPAIGVNLETLNSRVELPVPVDVESGRIGGPSAGLMIGLAVYDQSDPSLNLAGGRRIAGTGTLTSQGVVGRIGGVDLKALAAHERGADVFLVPATQFEEAHELLPDDTSMELYPVASFDEAVNVLLQSGAPNIRPVDVEPLDCPFRPAA